MKVVDDFLDGFTSLAHKVRQRTASDDENVAFGCAYMILGAVFLLSVSAMAIVVYLIISIKAL